jgi:hypothetical protein
MKNRLIAGAALVLTLLVPTTLAAQASTPIGDLTIEQLLQLEVEPVFGASKRMQPVGIRGSGCGPRSRHTTAVPTA